MKKCKCKAYQDAGTKPRTLITYGEPIVWYSAESKKPELYKVVLIAGGCALWNGENWVTCMFEQRVIQWEVKYWTEIPQSPGQE